MNTTVAFEKINVKKVLRKHKDSWKLKRKSARKAKQIHQQIG